MTSKHRIATLQRRIAQREQEIRILSGATSLSEKAIDTWTDRLTRLSRGMDLSYWNDRFDFRKKVESVTKNSRVGLIADLARHFGREPTNDSREAAALALAKGWEDNQ